ncbi:MAG: type pilus assembly protein PilC [Frankiaceae bacterium]|jgi:type IV pilus assembly protein PilC|nr:type pilus assembly protein PilC [Frankiaceae bacterium]
MTTMMEQPLENTAAADPKPPSRLKTLLQFELTKGKIKRKDLMHFSRQMAVFIKAGIPILEAIDSITEEMANKRFKQILLEIRGRLTVGETFADAAANYPEAFPEYYIGILRSAELAGTLDEVLVQLSGYIERDLEARRKVVSALMYPAIIAAMSVVVVVVLVTFVLPRFETFFKNLGAKLPLPTRILLSVAHFMTNWWFLFVALLVVLVGVVIAMQKTERGRDVRDRLLLRVPVLGDLVHHALLERFCRVLGSMIQGGVPLPDAMAVTAAATANRVFQRGLGEAREEMMQGAGLAGPLAKTGLFPPAAKQMFRVGEGTGSLDEQLGIAAEYFDRELDYKLKRFTALFEPLVIVGMGAVVGFVAIALISAMYGIFRTTHVG